MGETSNNAMVRIWISREDSLNGLTRTFQDSPQGFEGLNYREKEAFTSAIAEQEGK